MEGSVSAQQKRSYFSLCSSGLSNPLHLGFWSIVLPWNVPAQCLQNPHIAKRNIPSSLPPWSASYTINTDYHPPMKHFHGAPKTPHSSGVHPTSQAAPSPPFAPSSRLPCLSMDVPQAGHSWTSLLPCLHLSLCWVHSVSGLKISPRQWQCPCFYFQADFSPELQMCPSGRLKSSHASFSLTPPT